MFLRIMAVLLGLVGIAGIGPPYSRPRNRSRWCRRPLHRRLPPPPPAPKPHILAASRALRAGALLVMEDISVIEAAAGQEPQGGYPDTIAARSSLRGAMVRRSLSPNEPILSGDVLNPGDRGFLASVLGTGMRAVTVGVDPVSGTAGLIWPGDHVDLVLTQSIEDKDQPVERRVSGETVLTNARVIAVDQQLVQGAQGAQASPTAANNRTVTIEATVSTPSAWPWRPASAGSRSWCAPPRTISRRRHRNPRYGSCPHPRRRNRVGRRRVACLARSLRHQDKAGSTIRVNRGKDVEEMKFQWQ